ncbi:MAG: gamma-glutamylcyclotransferase [Novosphingobium sp.]|nr:gamma-glutamylcyclotransferase [Novosphingobium sp.]
MRFFFYGTLTHEATNPVARALHARLGAGRRGYVRGRLHAIPLDDGWYPGFVADPAGGRVSGYLYDTLPDFTPADLARMDAYEGYDPRDPEAGDYARETMAVELEAGRAFAAEVYVHRAELPAASQPIEGGDFAAWLAATGRSAFAPGDAKS